MRRKKNRNFQESTRHLFRLYTMIPFAILIVLFFVFTAINGRITLTNRTAEASLKISQSISGVYTQYEAEAMRMAASPSVVNYVSNHLDSEDVYAEFYDFNNRQQVKSIFHIVDTQGVFLASSAAPDEVSSDLAFGSLIHRISLKPEALLTEMNSFRYSHDRYTDYTFGKAILKDGHVIGYLVLQLLEADMQKLIFVQNTEVAVVTDEHHTIIATTSNITKGILNKFAPKQEGNNQVLLNGGKYYMHTREVQDTPIRVHTLNSVRSESYTLYTLSIFILATSLLLWIIIHFLAQKMSERNSESIDKLVYALRKLREGNLNEYVDIHTGDEFEILGEQYNNMLDRLKDLLEKNKELSRISTLVEVKQLQSQFHPHFIFNVLETLRYAIKIDAKQAQDIVMILSRLLRYSIGNERSVKLNDDLNYVRDYLNLQQIRFKERLNYNIQIKDDAGNIYVPKLLLQAMIENSIKYGYKDQSSVNIDIIVYTADGKLVLQVLDNGPGMSPERLEEVHQILKNHHNTTEHIGLYNIHRRLILLYGEESGIDIRSSEGIGTCVTLTIPYEMGDQDV
ncbi:HAMP domain-containing protein [Paenibacillus sp. HJL G12]|uniref:histidine kinase n=1 Tax=Paenibacillus dendrobii TaxID=2691084 RepID=A0A7X3IMW2_9BACL|nr:histidine kinase [Paenibacillus dendrobii]MWV45570.1 HAMP domain-containing protein [Paenibacillus dendrobii]